MNNTNYKRTKFAERQAKADFKQLKPTSYLREALETFDNKITFTYDKKSYKLVCGDIKLQEYFMVDLMQKLGEAIKEKRI